MNNNDIKEFENQLQASINTACEYQNRIHYGVRMFGGYLFITWGTIRLINFFLSLGLIFLPLICFGIVPGDICTSSFLYFICFSFWFLMIQNGTWISLSDNRVCFNFENYQDFSFSSTKDIHYTPYSEYSGIKDGLSCTSASSPEIIELSYPRLKQASIDPVKLYKFVLKFNSRQRKIISAARTFVLETKSPSQLDGLLSIAKDKVGGGIK